MTIKTMLGVAALSLSALLAGPAAADTVQFKNIEAMWLNGTPSNNISSSTSGYDDFAAVYWGGERHVSDDSGYTYASPAVQPLSVSVSPGTTSPNFVLGTFQHINNPISTGTSITGVDLYVKADVVIQNVDEGDRVFKFHFTHNETPNDVNPCANGQANKKGVNINGCADNVNVNVLTTTDTFTLDDKVYTINILGFVQDNAFQSSYWTVENKTNTAFLQANVDLYQNIFPPAAPEPATWAMLGLGFAALGYAGLRRSKGAASPV